MRRGDKVIATARGRSINKLADLKEKGADVLEIDVTDSLDKLREVAAKAVKIHGRVDVLVNNAGMLSLHIFVAMMFTLVLIRRIYPKRFSGGGHVSAFCSSLPFPLD